MRLSGNSVSCIYDLHGHVSSVFGDFSLKNIHKMHTYLLIAPLCYNRLLYFYAGFCVPAVRTRGLFLLETRISQEMDKTACAHQVSIGTLC